MSFYINTDRIGDVAILQCAGRMVRPQGLSLLKDAVISCSQLRVIVLDLSEVEMLDAAGLGLLISLHIWACENGIQLKVANPSKLVREMVELTGLASVLHISSVDDLIEIFCNSDRAIGNMHRAVA